MKSTLSALILSIIFLQHIDAQSPYKREQLQKSSMEQLEVLLEKSANMKKTGKILTIGGPVIAVAGVAIFNAAWAGNFGGSGATDLGAVMMLGGLASTAVGIPLLITGVSRSNRVQDQMEMMQSGFSPGSGSGLYLQPVCYHHPVAAGPGAGLAVSFRF